MFKKKIPWMLLFLLMMGLSIWAVVSRSSSFSFSLLKETIQTSNPWWLGAAVVGMLCNILCEGIALDFLVRALTYEEGKPRIKSHGLLYSSADIYFSAITPSASGGQPASAYFMNRDGIPMAKALVILVLNMLFYTASLVIIGVIGFALSREIFFELDPLAKIFILVGFAVLVGLCVIFWLLLRKAKWVKGVAIAGIALGAKFHIVRRKEVLREKLDRAIEQYKECSALIFVHKKTMATALLFNLLQRASLVSTTVLVYLAFGGSVANLPSVIAAQCLVLVGVYSLPVPGGMGVADYLLINALSQIAEIESPANLELISRGISFYSCIALTIIILVVGYFLQTRRIKKRKAQTK
ncbi:MAG: flippase-like domain-containing protein [Clostridiales bacterium]|nr:flippase-like domain-containing protein [Candidatus Scatonaster coprocaballi]